jgi:hypothetical protein
VTHPFAPSLECIDYGFRELTAPMTFPDGAGPLPPPGLGDAFQSGDPRAQLAVIRPLWDAGPVSWPWYDQWERTFNDYGTYPYVWRSFADKPDRILRLFDHTLFFFIYRRLHANQIFALGGTRPYLRPRFHCCQVERDIGQGQLLLMTFENPASWPPFFPGDRTSIDALNARDLVRYGVSLDEVVTEAKSP